MTAIILEFPTAAVRAAREAAELECATAFVHRRMAEQGYPVAWEVAELIARASLEAADSRL
mgnify:CR=1 FL=1|jgi:hypothetical protein